MNKKSKVITGAVLSTLTLLPSSVAYAADTPQYLEAVGAGVTIKTLATAGDSIGGYNIPGIPDGMGAFKLPNGQIRIFVNHEIGNTTAAKNVSRAGGAITGGAAITALTVDPITQTVVSAADAIKSVSWYDYSTGKFGSTPKAPIGAAASNSYGSAQHTQAVDRFCSSAYFPNGSFSAKVNGKTIGYTGGLYLTGEESGNEGRGFALTSSGQLAQLPRLGLASWESFIQVPTGNEVTALIGGEDGDAGKSELWLYAGKKTNKGAWYDRAGLNNGRPYVLALDGISNDNEFRSKIGKGVPVKATFKEIYWNVNGVAQNNEADIAGMGFTGIEDGTFDPKNRNVYYFVTKDSNKDAKATTLNPDMPEVTKRDGGGIWKVTFKDVRNPLKGASVELLLDGSEAPYLNMPDNVTIDSARNLLIQEDPGKNDQLSRVIAYNLDTKKFATIAQFKADFFKPNAANFITFDEESSGINEVTALFRTSAADTKKYYILDAQVHSSDWAKLRPDITDAAAKSALTTLVEGGQIYLLTVDSWANVNFK